MSDVVPNAPPLNLNQLAEAEADMRMTQLSVEINEFLRDRLRPGELYFVELTIPILGSNRTACVFFSNGNETQVQKMLGGALEDLRKPPPAQRADAN